MENIFKNAYFGKAYKTRGGDKVILVTLLDKAAYLLSENKIKDNSFEHILHAYRLDGICTEYQGYVLDIVSEWQEETAEEELEELLAEQNYPYPLCDKSDMCVAHSNDGLTRVLL